MKKIFLIVSAVAVMYSCGSKNGQEVADVNAAVDSLANELVADAHNAANSLDVIGAYAGVTPGANDSIAVTITLGADSTYTRTAAFAAHPENVIKTEGKYEWNAEGNTITLLSDEKPNQYFVGENQLFSLDIEGNKITGDLADKYILKKVVE